LFFLFNALINKPRKQDVNREKDQTLFTQNTNRSASLNSCFSGTDRPTDHLFINSDEEVEEENQNELVMP
jgi:ssRNA-specific RNase YbeY (16S rRNA maturation enzyme)